MDIKSTSRRFTSYGVRVAWLFLAFTACGHSLLGADRVVPYDGRCEAPCPPETVASLLDGVIKDHASGVTLTLVRHPQPSTQPADARAAWVCMVDGRPRWILATVPRVPNKKSSGLTARALQRAREFLADKEESKRELKDKSRPRDWRPKKEALLPAYQSREYGLQITKIELIDRKTESWKITAKPIKESVGGETWMRFDRKHKVSANFGR